ADPARFSGLDAADDRRRPQAVVSQVTNHLGGMSAGDRGQEASRGLGIAEQELLPLRDIWVVVDPARQEAAIGVSPAGGDARLHVIPRRGKDWDQMAPDRRGD